MRFVALSFCGLILSFAALAQSDRGSITGTVTDPAGAVVASAPIQAKNANTGAVYPTATSGTGNYTLAELPVGTYEITVTAPGFKREIRTGVEVASQTTFRVDFALQVGAAAESVTITAEAPLLKTESGELAHNVTVDTMDNLPILTIGSDGAGVRNPLAALLLLPGASFTSDAILRINGLPSSSQSIRIEGQDATNGFWKEINSQNQAGVDAIQEVAIQTSNFAPEYGQAGGGYINYTMKSGTNQYHGSAFDYSANDALNAGTPFTNAGATNSLKDNQLIRNSLRRFDFGGTFGGPIRIPKVYNGTDRTFFFFSYEQYIQKTLTTGTLATPPHRRLSARQLLRGGACHSSYAQWRAAGGCARQQAVRQRDFRSQHAANRQRPDGEIPVPQQHHPHDALRSLIRHRAIPAAPGDERQSGQ
ncbi:MAG TPA: carboxypeptidase-like regulatory domain-containing protein [Bryobacteraceae bacterium]